MKDLIKALLDDETNHIEKWHNRSEQFRGKWMPYDHIKFIHDTSGVRQNDFIILAQSNEHILKNDRYGEAAAHLQRINEARYQNELKRFEQKLSDGLSPRRPKLQKNIRWMQRPIAVSELDGYYARDEINAMFVEDYDTFVSMSTSWAKDSRKRETLSSVNCIWLDLDLNDQDLFIDRPEDIAYYFLEFIEQTDFLPLPSAIVESGGGIHIYWKTSAIPIAAYPRFFSFMRHLHEKVRSMGLEPDPACVDPSRVLRLCKTYNSKYPDSTCELLWRSEWVDAAISFDDFCDAVFPMSRDAYHTKREVDTHLKQAGQAIKKSNTPSGFQDNIYVKILEDLEKISFLKRFSQKGLRDRFLWNYTVALSYVVHVSEIHSRLVAKCNEMRIELSQFWDGLQSVFKRISDKSCQKYRLSVKRIIFDLGISEHEMLDLNLRVLRSKEVRKIHKRLDRASSRNQKSVPKSKLGQARERHEITKMALAMLENGHTKSFIAKQLKISRSTLYRWLRLA